MIREKPILRRPFHEGFALLFAGLLFLSCGSANALPISKSASFATGNTNIVQVATSICALINTQIEDLKSRKAYSKVPPPTWIVNRLARYEEQLERAGCTSSGGSGSSSGGGVSWLSGMSCTDMATAASWRGSPITASVGWAPHTGDWNDIMNYFSGGNMNKFINAKNNGALPSIGLPMLPESHRGQLRNCAKGQFDSYFTKIASLLKGRGLGDIVLRLGWEANLQSYPWIADYGVNSYKQCYRRIVRKMRAVSPQLKFDWHNGKRTRFNRTAADLYPGNAFVDYIGLSYYDRDLDNRTQAKWDESSRKGTAKNPEGIETWLNFAKSRGKKLAVSEWGITNRGDTSYYQGNGDNDLFVRNMFEFFKRNSANLAYESYFNCTSGDPTVYLILPENYNPKSSAMYKSLY